MIAYSDNYSINSLAAKASLSFCSLCLKEQSMWAARVGASRFLTGYLDAQQPVVLSTDYPALSRLSRAVFLFVFNVTRWLAGVPP